MLLLHVWVKHTVFFTLKHTIILTSKFTHAHHDNRAGSFVELFDIILISTSMGLP